MNINRKASKRIELIAGFTLIEVMVALAIIAIALSAVSQSLGLTVSNQTHLESRVLATWVAENAIVEEQLFPGKKTENQQVQTMLNREWVIEVASEPTFIPEIYKMSVAVREKGSEQLSANLFSVVGTMNNLTLKLQRQQGFTLIELLVALGVSAVIAVLAYQSIDSMVNVKTSVEEHASQSEKLQRAVWWMEQDFIQLAPRPIQDELGSNLPAFQYRADTGVELSRIAQFPTPNSNGGLQRVSYVLDNSILYRLTWPVMDRAPDSKPTKVALLNEVKTFDVELLNAANQWVKSWPAPTDSLDELPKATRVVIEHKTLGTLSRLYMGGELVLIAREMATPLDEKQKGFALLTVLLVVALVSMVSSQLLYDQQVHIQRSTYMIHQAHSISVAYGFEGWVKKGLKADAQNNPTDHLNEQWAQPLIPVAFAEGMVSGRLHDLHAHLNLNNVLEKEPDLKSFWKKMVERYLAQRLPEEQFIGFADVLTDWVDADDDPQDYGAESEVYLLNEPAYRAANQPMVMVSELKNLQGMEKLQPLDMQKIEQYLAALPGVTTLNVNTVDIPVLTAMADWLTEDIAKQWVEYRKAEPAEDVGTFMAFLTDKTGFMPDEIAKDIPVQVIDVKSQYFLLQAQVDYGDVKQVVSSIFNRKSENEVTLVQRWLSVG